MAPDEDKYQKDSQKLVWLRHHERGAAHGNNSNKLHAACLQQYCNRCHELWGCSMAQYATLSGVWSAVATVSAAARQRVNNVPL